MHFYNKIVRWGGMGSDHATHFYHVHQGPQDILAISCTEQKWLHTVKKNLTIR